MRKGSAGGGVLQGRSQSPRLRCCHATASSATRLRCQSTARTPGTGTRGTYTPAYGKGIVDADAATAAP
jgi:hypothetical protein